MRMFSFFKKKKEIENEVMPPKEEKSIDFSTPIDPSEEEIVSVLATSIAAGNHLDTNFRVKRVEGIDVDKEIAVAIVGAIMANEQKESSFRLKRVTEITDSVKKEEDVC